MFPRNRAHSGQIAHTHFVQAEPLESRVLLSAASRLTDIMPGAEDSLALSSGQYVAAGGKFYFAAVDSHGQQPYVSDGTAAGTMPLVAGGLNGGNNAEPGDFTAGGGFVYFTALTSTNSYYRQVFRTDVSTGATVQVSSLPSPGSASNMAFVNGHLIFEDLNNLNLYRVDGTTSVRFATGMQEDPYAVVGNKLFFDNPGVPNHPTGLYVTDGSSFTFLAAVSPYLLPTGAAFNNDLYFESTGTDSAGSELWASNGTAGGTSRVNDFAASSPGYGPRNFTVSGGSLYFAASNPSGQNQQIYRTDGVTTTQVTNISLAGDGISNLTDVNGTLYFVLAPKGVRPNLYKLVNGQPVLVGTTSGGPDGGTNPADLTAVGSTLYFTGLDTNGKVRLFETDGTNITLAPGDAGTNPSALTSAAGSLFYEASDTTHGAELHVVPSSLIPPPPAASLSITGKFEIDEGDPASVKFRTTVTGGTPMRFAWNFGDGKKLNVSVPPRAVNVFSHSFTDAAPGLLVVKVKMKTTDGQILSQRVLVTIHNVSPKVSTKPSLPFTVPGLPITFTANFEDPGINDTFTIDWDFGDGTPKVTESLGKNRVATITHTFNKVALDYVHVTVEDSTGGVGHSTTPMDVEEVSVQRVKRLRELYVGSLSGTHRVVVESVSTGIEVLVDGVQTGIFNGIKAIQVFAGPLEKVIVDPGLQPITKISKSNK